MRRTPPMGNVLTLERRTLARLPVCGPRWAQLADDGSGSDSESAGNLIDSSGREISRLLSYTGVTVDCVALDLFSRCVTRCGG